MPIDNLEKDLPYGFFNQTSVNNLSKMTLDNNSYSKESLLNEIIREKVSNNVFENKSLYNAIVLHIEGINPNNFINFITIPFFKAKTEKIKVTARIPELHSHLPVPDDLTNISPIILSMYPVFEGPTSLGVPKIGSIIQVSFDDVNLQSGPRYLGSDENSSYVGGATIQSSNTSESNNEKSNGFFPPASYANGKMTSERLWYFDRMSNTPIDLIAIHESVGKSRDTMVRDLAGKGLGIHYSIERDGSRKQHVDEKFQTPHGGGGRGQLINARSISIEIINKVVGKSATTGEEVVFPIWKADSTGYILPTIKQVESCWELVQQISARNNIPIIFPSNQGRILNFGRHYGYHNGIMCHKLWDENRSDGPFIMNYCYLRSLGYSITDSWNILYKTTQKEFNQQRYVKLDELLK